MSKPMSVGRWFRNLVVVGNITLLDDHHEVGDPGQQFSSGFAWPHGQIRKPLDDLFIIGLCRKLLLKPWFQIHPGELSLGPVKHVCSGEEPILSEPFEGIGLVSVGSGVGPLVRPCQSSIFLMKTIAVTVSLDFCPQKSGIFDCSTLKARVV